MSDEGLVLGIIGTVVAAAVITVVVISSGGDPTPPPATSTVELSTTGTRSAESDNVRFGVPVWPPALNDGEIAPSVVADRSKINVVLVSDISPSMNGECGPRDAREPKIESARTAMLNFLDQPVVADTNVGFVKFGGSAAVENSLGSSTFLDVRQSVEAMSGNGNGTNITQGIKVGYLELERQARAQLGLGSYHLVLLGDGEPTTGGDPRPWLDWVVANTRVHVHTIGFCADISVLDRYGVNYYPAANAAELNAAFAQVLAEGAPGSGDVNLALFEQN